MKIWIVTMYRFGDREKHSYVLGAFSSFAEALKYGDAEEEYRGGKYKWEWAVAELDKPLYTHEAQNVNNQNTK